MAADRPINADVPGRDEPQEAVPGPGTPQPPEPTPPKPKPRLPKAKPSRRRRPRAPGALLAIGGLVVLAVALIVLAVVAGSGGGPGGETTVTGPAPAPVVVQGETSGGEGGEAEAPATESAEALGYPAFATDNTTRVGGATAAENAAAVALAVFPSTTAAQRPAAVALVAEDDWPVAIAAAVLMAPPVRAPLLFSSADGAPAATEEALAALEPQGGKATGGARGFAFGDVAVPEGASGIEAIRAGGASGDADAAASAAAIADLRDRLFGSPPDAIVVAPLAEPGFAAPAAAWAARSGDPVLFAAEDSLPKPTAEAIAAHAKAPVYVLGPSSAISGKVMQRIEALGPAVKRVAGPNPVATALALARYGDHGFGWGVNDPGHGFVLARADAPLEAAAAAALSASGTWGPLLLTDGAGTLPPEVRSYLLDVKPGYTTNPTRAYYNHVWVIGDQEAIDVKQQAEANELAELAKIGAG